MSGVNVANAVPASSVAAPDVSNAAPLIETTAPVAMIGTAAIVVAAVTAAADPSALACALFVTALAECWPLVVLQADRVVSAAESESTVNRLNISEPRS